MSKCNSCNNELEEGAKFCQSCGRSTEPNANFAPPQTQFNQYPNFNLIVDNRPFATTALVFAILSICIWVFAALTSLNINTSYYNYYSQSLLTFIFCSIVCLVSSTQGVVAMRLSRPKDNVKKKLSTLAFIIGIVGVTFSIILLVRMCVIDLPLLIQLKRGY